MGKTVMGDELLDHKGGFRVVRAAEGTLRYYRLRGTGPASFKLGGRRVVYRRSEVDRWVAEQEISWLCVQ